MNALMKLLRKLRRLYHRLNPKPWNRVILKKQAIPGPLIENVFNYIREMPGWFNLDDATTFSTMLTLQSVYGVKGDILEIGTYFGRSASLLAHYLNKDEKLFICDPFESGLQYLTHEHASIEVLKRNIKTVTPDFDFNQLVVNQCFSYDLQLPEDQQFRFIHVDAGHSKEEAQHDLRLADAHLLEKGIISVDDYKHFRFPGVVEAVEIFMNEHQNYAVAADLNRRGASGRKLYLVKNSK